MAVFENVVSNYIDLSLCLNILKVLYMKLIKTLPSRKVNYNEIYEPVSLTRRLDSFRNLASNC